MAARRRDWAGLPEDILRHVADNIPDPHDFISFGAVCPQWRSAVMDADGRFHPWILKTDESAGGNVVFYCLGREKFIRFHVPALKGRRLAGFGAGHLIAINDKERSGVLVNPLLSTAAGGTTTLPPLPEWCVGGDTYGFATDPKMTGDKDVFVVIYKHIWGPRPYLYSNAPRSPGTYHVAMWRRGSDAGWAIIPIERFWTRMPMLRRRLAGLADDDDAGNGGVPWVPCEMDRNVLEHEGRVRFLSSRVTGWGTHPWPRRTFDLKEMMATAFVDINWDEAPELRDKIILYNLNKSPCCVLPVRAGEAIGLRKNGVYVAFGAYLEEGMDMAMSLCRFDWGERVMTVVKQLPGNWDYADGRWFLPTLK